MTNVTLSIDERVYHRMKQYSEIKWSEFIRKSILKRLNSLDTLKKQDKESILTMVASENVLKKDWDNALDERWNNV